MLLRNQKLLNKQFLFFIYEYLGEMNMITDYSIVYQSQLKKFKGEIMKDFIDYKKCVNSTFGFPLFKVTPKEFEIQKFFEIRVEHYIRTFLVNGLIGKILDYNGVGIYYSGEEYSNEKLSNIEFEKRYFYEFVADYEDKTVGYLYCDTDINVLEEKTTNEQFVEEINIVDWNSYYRKNDNKKSLVLSNGIKVEYISIRDLFFERLNNEEYDYYVTFMTFAINEFQEIIGVKSVPMLSSHYLSVFKFHVEKELLNYVKKIESYKEAESNIAAKNPEDLKLFRYGYKILKEENRKNEKYTDLEKKSQELLFDEYLLVKFLHERLYLFMIGESDFAKSFITSEYMYHQHYDDYHFDYTAIVSGYLKSIEQLLYSIALLHIDKKYKIKYSGGNNIHDEKPQIFKDKKTNISRVEFSTENLTCIDSTMGSLISFFRFYRELIPLEKEKEKLRELICNCLNIYRDECRNGAFHKSNISVKSKVEFIRDNTIYLIIVILTCFQLGESRFITEEKLGADKYLMLEKLYYLIYEGISEEFVFTYYSSDGIETIKSVVFNKNKSEFPLFDENGYVTHAHLEFVEKNTNERIIVDEKSIPRLIDIIKNDGSKEKIL